MGREREKERKRKREGGNERGRGNWGAEGEGGGGSHREGGGLLLLQLAHQHLGSCSLLAGRHQLSLYTVKLLPVPRLLVLRLAPHRHRIVMLSRPPRTCTSSTATASRPAVVHCKLPTPSCDVTPTQCAPPSLPPRLLRCHAHTVRSTVTSPPPSCDVTPKNAPDICTQNLSQIISLLDQEQRIVDWREGCSGARISFFFGWGGGKSIIVHALKHKKGSGKHGQESQGGRRSRGGGVGRRKEGRITSKTSAQG